LRTQINAEMARRIDPADKKAVADWVKSAFEQRQPRAVVMTPVVAMPVTPSPAAKPAEPSFPPAPPGGVNPVVFVLIGLVVIAVVVAALVLR
jgi:hypothetical protein